MNILHVHDRILFLPLEVFGQTMFLIPQSKNKQKAEEIKTNRGGNTKKNKLGQGKGFRALSQMNKAVFKVCTYY